VCEHINLPVQAGDDQVLSNMRRRYTEAEYRSLVQNIRDTIPGVSVSTDIIVGFPGETEQQYRKSLDLVVELQFDKVHSAAYSPRPGTIAHRTIEDDVPREEKVRRLKQLDDLQAELLAEVNAGLVGQDLEVLVEGRKKGKWQGRTRSNKLVFFEDGVDHLGELVNVEIQRSSPWSLQGTVVS
jgi:tRNA-2-methylthio-N6-dimethylallyladenosine synthase